MGDASRLGCLAQFRSELLVGRSCPAGEQVKRRSALRADLRGEREHHEVRVGGERRSLVGELEASDERVGREGCVLLPRAGRRRMRRRTRPISDYGYDETLHSFEKSAAKLDVEQIDLLILHQPLPSEFARTVAA